MGYEPRYTEIRLTIALGKTLLYPYYRGYVRSLGLKGDERILDYGSGSGMASRHIAHILSDSGGTLTCVDISQRWIEIARQTMRGYANVIYKLGPIAELDLEDGAYDSVFIHFVLHDVPAAERPEVVRHLARVLRRGGLLFLREPTLEGHGMPAAEIHTLMTQQGLHEVKMQEKRVLLTQSVCDGVFRKG